MIDLCTWHILFNTTTLFLLTSFCYSLLFFLCWLFRNWLLLALAVALAVVDLIVLAAPLAAD
jgi:hypothetical protein